MKYEEKSVITRFGDVTAEYGMEIEEVEEFLQRKLPEGDTAEECMLREMIIAATNIIMNCYRQSEINNSN